MNIGAGRLRPPGAVQSPLPAGGIASGGSCGPEANVARQRMPSSLPSAVERREFLFGRESEKADHGALADGYQTQGRMTDALEFYAKAGDEAGVERIRRIAVKSGDAFLLAQVVRTTGKPEEAAAWRETAERAERAGKIYFARAAYREAGDDDAANRLDETSEPDAAATLENQNPASA